MWMFYGLYCLEAMFMSVVHAAAAIHVWVCGPARTHVDVNGGPCYH